MPEIENEVALRKLALEAQRVDVDSALRRAELEEKREQRLGMTKIEHEKNALKRFELEIAQGKGIRFTGAQATVAVAIFSLLSGVAGALIQATSTRSVEAQKNAALVTVENIRVAGDLDLEKQKQLATERLEQQ